MTNGRTTREAILAAALADFATFGYRRTSIESIARRADVSRATVYLHYRGKEDIFCAVVSTLHDEHLAAMRAAAEDPDIDIHTRLIRLLQARFQRFVELMASSNNAAELYDVHNKTCGDITEEATRRADKIFAAALRRAVAAGDIDLTRSGLTISQLAGVLTDCASGAKGENPAAIPTTEFTARLTRSVRAILSGVGSRGA
ncbi:TetR/AcrR family transcriptional regulator [Mycobacterium simiae]|uniref:TetR/AcrR family transcriptional regulator n=1 Tax=Mycobacterium simiae TaxID=1784 RepID=UPI00165FE128|nr:TetR/AcrR family transcriptional regulator [Mycobacterium simiae]